MRLLVALLVGQLLPSFFILWYDLLANSLTNYPTNNRIRWIWMRKKIGLYIQFVPHVYKHNVFLMLISLVGGCFRQPDSSLKYELLIGSRKMLKTS